MFRYRFYVQVRYGHFREYLALAEQLNELGRSRGWKEATFWAPTVGGFNELIAETDYPDLATFERQNRELHSDAEAMELFRSQNEHVIEGSRRDELLETAPHIA